MVASACIGDSGQSMRPQLYYSWAITITNVNRIYSHNPLAANMHSNTRVLVLIPGISATIVVLRSAFAGLRNIKLIAFLVIVVEIVGG